MTIYLLGATHEFVGTETRHPNAREILIDRQMFYVSRENVCLLPPLARFPVTQTF
ncbi:MAG: hypothetical protein ABI520_04875 [Caldimonas sp.]